MAPYLKVETIGSIGSIIFAMLEVGYSKSLCTPSLFMRQHKVQPAVRPSETAQGSRLPPATRGDETEAAWTFLGLQVYINSTYFAA